MKNLKQNKTDKKGGLFGFLNSGANAASGVTPGVIGGTAAQASGGLLSILTGKVLSTVLTVAILGGAGMVYMSGRSGINGGDMPNSQLMAEAAQEAAGYVPAMQRMEAENQGKSAIAMFKDKNKGAVKFDIDPTLNNKNAKGSSADGEDYDENALGEYGDIGEYSDAASASAAEAGEGGAASVLNNSNLSTSFGGGDKSAKSLNMGGSKPKLKPTFKSMANMKPLTNFKNSKALAYGKTKKANKVSASRVGARGGRGALNQAKAMNSMLRSATGAKNYSTARATTDAAWVGTTGDGEAASTLDAAGLSEGEGMTVGALGSGGASGNSNTNYQPGNSIPDVSDSVDVTPWAKDLQKIQTYLMIAMAMLGVAALLWDSSKNVPIWGAFGAILVGIMIVAALALSAMAFMLAMKLKSEYGQSKLGMMWMLLSGASFVGCCFAVWGGLSMFGVAKGSWAATNMTMILSITALLGGLGSALMGSMGNKSVDSEQAKAYCKSHPEHDGCYNTSALPYELQDSPVNKTMLS